MSILLFFLGILMFIMNHLFPEFGGGVINDILITTLMILAIINLIQNRKK